MLLLHLIFALCISILSIATGGFGVPLLFVLTEIFFYSLFDYLDVKKKYKASTRN